MPHITFDHYVRYDELTNNLQAFASEFPNLVTVESIGKSYEGRDIWLVTVTNRQTGDASEKPAIWADANIHATEVSPTTAVLYLINKLTSEYGKNADITRALDTRVFYLCPRVNPDGAELALADKPRYIRSSTKWYPYPEEDIEGFINEDMDGDGRALMMRIKDPNGAWKQHPDEPRLLTRRDPAEIGGTYYRLMNEGRIENYDGVTIRMKRITEGLDLNRNFPANWRQEVQQYGAGKYPTSEPEVHAIVDFIANHPNITNGITFHTWSGVLLRPYGTLADDNFPVEDLRVYKKIGEKGTEITGYPAVSVFHDFKYHPKEVITGVFDDWLYDHLGIFGWTVEIWSPQRQAGIGEYKYIEWYQEHPHEDDLKMLKWNDDVLGGKGYVDWYAFNHPQLGEVELGGWDMMYAWRNPPPQFLEKEIAPFSDWLIWQALITPKLELYSSDVTKLGDGVYKIQLVVHNTGWLPTQVSQKAVEKKSVRGVIFEIKLPVGLTLTSGKLREEMGQLAGRALTPSSISPWTTRAHTDDRAKYEWVVSGVSAGTEIEVIARHERAGIVRQTVKLG